MITLPRICLALAMAALAACSGGTGSDATRPPSGFGEVRGVVSGLFGRGEAPVDARNVLTPALVAGSPTPLMLVVVDRTDRAFTMVPLAENLGTRQWRDGAGGAIFQRSGVLVGTRGLGHDLLTADVAPLRAALRQGGGDDVQRVNRILDGENQVIAQQFICSVRPIGSQTLNLYGASYKTTLLEEDCVGDGAPFVNRYWVQSNGTIRQSQIQVSPEAGSLTLTLLKV